MAPDQARQALKDAYLIEFPEDLFRFWQFTQEFGEADVLHTFTETLGIRLEGPFAVLAGTAEAPANGWYLGSRYYDDPPEFVTVLSGDTDGLHWGYWYDDPDNSPDHCLVDYYSSDANELAEDGESLFEAFRLQLEGCYRDDLEYMEDASEHGESPSDYEANLEKYTLYRERLMRYATGGRTEVGDDYLEKYAGLSGRAVVADTFEGMGIVVPEASYRPLLISDDEFRAKAIADADLSEHIAEAQRAMADGYPGTALKLGRDLWLGNARQKQDSYRLLESAYEALHRPTLQRFLKQIASARTE